MYYLKLFDSKFDSRILLKCTTLTVYAVGNDV